MKNIYRYLKSIRIMILLISVVISTNLYGQITHVDTETATAGWTTSITINKPSGVSEGDLMIAHIYQFKPDMSGTVTPSLAGWEKIAEDYTWGEAFDRGTLLYKFADASDAGISEYTFTAGSFTYGAGAIVAFSGVKLATPGPVTGAFSHGANVTCANPNGVDAVQDALIVMFAMDGWLASVTTMDFLNWHTENPIGTPHLTLTENYDIVFNESAHIGAAWAYQSTAGAFAKGYVCHTLQGGEYPIGAFLLALEPACTTPTVSIEGPTSICAGRTTNLSPTTGGTWVSNNPSVASVTNDGIVTGLSEGTASFTFTVDGGTCFNTTGMVTVSSTIMPSISSVTAVPAIICNGASTTLTVSGDLGCADHWVWYQYSCGGTPVGTGSTVTLTPYPGTYTYYVRGEGGSLTTPGACSSTTVTIYEWPSASITGGEQNACVNTTLTATTNASNPSFAWYKNDVLIDGETGQNLVVSQVGNYKVKITSGVTGCERLSSAFPVLSVSQMPINRDVFASQSKVCPNSSVNIGITSAEEGVYYRLRKGDVFISDPLLGHGWTMYIPTGPLAATTTINVLAIKGNCTLEMANKLTVEVGVIDPSITSVTANPAAICWQGTTTLTVSGDLGCADHWAWYEYSCGGTSVGTGQTLTLTPFPGTRTYYVRGEGGSVGAGGTCSSTTVTIYEWHTASITGGDQNACVSTTLTATTNASSPSFAWYKNDVLIDGASSQTLLVTEVGAYKVEITSAVTGCVRMSNAFTVNSVSQMPANKTVFADPSTVCPGTRVNIGIFNSESGVWYRLRNDNGDVNIGDLVSGMNGVTIYITAGNLTETTTYNVLAIKGYCTLEMIDKPTVTVLSTEPSITEVTAVPATICQGSESSLTVTGTLGKANAWNWYKDGCGNTLVGTGESITVSPTETTTYYVRGEGGCATPDGICSEVTVTVNPSFTPSVTLTSSAADNKICVGTEVTFTTHVSNTGGGEVAYVWIYNDTRYEYWGDSWMTTELEDGDEVSCEITVTGGTCLTKITDVSDIITTTVYDRYTPPSVAIESSDPDNNICQNEEVIFTATPHNTSGGVVSYQWMYEDIPVGSNQNTYTSTELDDGDRVWCIITVTDGACFSDATATSNEIVTSVIPMPTVSIASDDADNSVCVGTSVKFTATPINLDGGSISYMWFKNDVNVGSDQNTYVETSLKNEDVVFCLINVTGGICGEHMAASNEIKVMVYQCSPGVDDCFEPNNSLAEAKNISVGATDISGNILSSKDQDWFKFTTISAGYYTINFNPNGGKETVELCNAKGQKLRSGSKNGMTYDLVANTTYYIKIYDTKLKVGSPCYSLNVGYSSMMPAGFIDENIEIKVAKIVPTPDGFFKIWPNPTKHEFELYNGTEAAVQVRVMDVIGRTIEAIENVGIAETVVFGSNYKPGIYFVETAVNGASKVFKLVKQ